MFTTLVLAARRLRRVAARRPPAALRGEELERRDTPSTLTWTNPDLETNGFRRYFGANAERAGAVVTEGLAYLGRVIADFNYDGDNNPATNNTFPVAVSVAPLGPGDRGSSRVDIVQNGLARRGTVVISPDAAGQGWYLDPAPTDDAEFPNPTTRTTASQGGTAADLLRCITHELAHAVGFAATPSLRLFSGGFLQDAGTDQVDGRSKLYLFSGPSTQVTLTTSGGLHTYEGKSDPRFPGRPTAPSDLMNPGRAVATGTVRQLISDTDARLLRDAYGFTITLPSTLRTFLVVRNATTGELVVNGDPQVGADAITVAAAGANVSVRVNTVSAVVPAAGVTRVQIRAGAGLDRVTLESFPTAAPVLIDAGDGNDTIALGGGRLGGLPGPVTVDGRSGTDAVTLDDAVTTTPDGYTLTAGAVGRPGFGGLTYTGVEQVNLLGGAGANGFDVRAGSSGVAVALTGGAGDDTFRLSAGAAGKLAVDGGDGTDTLDYSAHTTGVTVDLGRRKATGVTDVGGVENVRGGSGRDDLTGDARANVLVGGGGDDTLDGGSGRDVLIGGTGKDTLKGGSGDDILVGGSTAFDGDTGALIALVTEWSSGRSYADRTRNVTGSGCGPAFEQRANGTTFLRPLTVTDDGARDALTGGSDLDLFFGIALELNDYQGQTERVIT